MLRSVERRGRSARVYLGRWHREMEGVPATSVGAEGGTSPAVWGRREGGAWERMWQELQQDDQAGGAKSHTAGVGGGSQS